MAWIGSFDRLRYPRTLTLTLSRREREKSTAYQKMNRLLDRIEGLRPHSAVKWCGDKEGPFLFGLRHGGTPLLHGVWSERGQDVSLQRLQAGPAIEGGELGEHFYLRQPGLTQPPVEAGVITAQGVAPITRPARGFYPGFQLGW